MWVKHENHAPTGAFKVRGGIVYLAELQRTEPRTKDVICATRGNHGQSVAFSAGRLGLRSTIVVPRGNSRDKNASMRALGASLIECGEDFQAAAEHASLLASQSGAHLIPSFHPLLVAGVASYALEFLQGVPDLDTVYVPIGLGSGICGMVAARDALGLSTRIVGVVADGAPTYLLSFEAGRPVSTPRATTIADGIACRVPDPSAVEIIRRGVERILTVPDAAISIAVRHYFTDTHNVAEGAGAASLAGLLQDGFSMRGKRVGVVLSGGNVDLDLYVRLLSETPPTA